MPINLSSSIPVTLSDLHDVSIVSPQTGQYLRYNDTIPAWQNAFLDSVNATPGVWGSSTEIPIITADSQGRITSITTISLTDSQTGVTTIDNSSYGVSALTANVSGLMNTAIGSSSLLSNDTGNNNVALGNNSLASNTSGSCNTAIGNNALFANTTLSYNTAIGFGALSAATGTTNVGIGYNAGIAIGSGNYNVIIGGSSGESVANTDNNIVISDGMGNDRIFVDSAGLVTIMGALTVTDTLTATINGNASSATALATPYAINATGDATWSVLFDGSADVSSVLTLATTVNSSPQTDTFRKITVNNKGLVTATSAVSYSDITTALGYTPVNRAGDTMTGPLTVTQINGSGAGLTNIPNSALTNSAITIGGTQVTLGTTVTSLTGLTSISANTFSGSFSGTTTSATVLSVPRNIALTGDAAWSVVFDGSANVSSIATLATVNANPQTDTFRKITVNEKGLVTATAAVLSSDITAALGYTPVNAVGSTMTGALILNADPVLALGAATKQYVDNIATGISVHLACETASTSALPLCTYSNGIAGVGATLISNTNVSINTAGIGGYTNMVPGTRVLIKDQSSSLQNGIYVVSVVGVTGSTPWVLTRASDFDGSPTTEIFAGVMMYIQEGDLVGTQWIETAIGTGMPGDYIIVGTNPIVFTQFSGAGTYLSGTGINIANNIIANTGVTSIVAGTNIAVSGSSGAVTVSMTGTVPSATTAGTVTTNANLTGVVTSVGNATTITAGAITNTMLANTSITLGTTSISLGSSVNDINGLTSVTATTFWGTATKASNIANGAPGYLPYQSAVGVTTLLAPGSSGQVLSIAAGLPTWATPSVSGISLTGNTLSSGITISSLTSVGTLTNLTVTNPIVGSITNATYLSATQQTSVITGKSASLNMATSDSTNNGSFVCRATGAGDTNLAGLSLYNDTYAIKFGVRADGYVGLGGWSRAAWSWYSDPSGNMVAAGNVTAYSDPRLKDKVTIISDPISILNSLDGVRFTWNNRSKLVANKWGKQDVGVLADQVKKVLPEIVSQSIPDDVTGETFDTVDYSKLVPVLIEAIKELNARIKVLEAK